MITIGTRPVTVHPEEMAIHLTDTTISRWLQLIRAEYMEMPGLHLTEAQVRRLWSLDSVTAEALLAALLDVKFLRRTHQGAYVRADQG